MEINFQPSWKQHLAWQALEDGTTEEVVYGGAAGGGKSFLGAAWKIYRRLRYPGSRGITGRTVMKDIRESTLITYFKVLAMWGLTQGRDYTYNAQSFYLQFSNGSREVFRDLGYSPSDHDYQRLGSSEYTDAWIEEAGDGVPEKAADILKSRVRWMLAEFGLVPKLLITCNPGYHWVRTKYFFDNDDNPVRLLPHQQVVQALVTDNPDREFVRIYKKSLEGLSSDYDRQRLLDGDWNAVERTGGEQIRLSLKMRRAYTTADYRLIKQQYRDCTAPELARRLGRTVGSIKRFIQARPELHKRTLLQAA